MEALVPLLVRQEPIADQRCQQLEPGVSSRPSGPEVLSLALLGILIRGFHGEGRYPIAFNLGLSRSAVVVFPHGVADRTML